MNVVVITIIILRNISWVWNNVVYLWIQEESQEEYTSNKGAWAKLLRQVGTPHLYLS
jgi:hypothetical protein